MVTRMNDSRYTGTLLAIIFVTLGFMSQSCATETVAPMKSLPKADVAANTIQVAELDAGPDGKWKIYGAPDNQNHPTTLPGKVLAADPPEHHAGPGGSYTINLSCYGPEGICARFRTVDGQRRYLDTEYPSNESGGGAPPSTYIIERLPYP